LWVNLAVCALQNIHKVSGNSQTLADNFSIIMLECLVDDIVDLLVVPLELGMILIVALE
jgi:hypothetical protein